MAKTLYSRFSIDEREILFKRLCEGKSQKDISKELGRHPSTVSREIRRAGMSRSTYRPSIAKEDAKQETFKRKRKYKLIEHQDLAEIIEDKLIQKWSPEQISGALKKLPGLNDRSRVGGALRPRPLTEPCVRVRTRLFMLTSPIL